ncbi:MAG: DUF4348 domain-containing protein [Bacteroidales bacterium]|jgi:hypothetical protein
MKKNTPVLFIFIFFCVTAFSQHSQKIVVKTNTAEDFSIFQSRFFSDSSYQSDRIRFPLGFLKPDTYPRQIQKGDWKFKAHLHWSKTNPSNIHFRLIEVVDADQNKVIHGKLDNGVYENYTFSLENGKWILVKLEIPDL